MSPQPELVPGARVEFRAEYHREEYGVTAVIVDVSDVREGKTVRTLVRLRTAHGQELVWRARLARKRLKVISLPRRQRRR